MSGPRVAYLTGQFPRTTDTFIQREIAALRDSGYTIDTFSVRPTNADDLTTPEQRATHADTTNLLELARTAALPRAVLGTLVRSPARFVSGLALALRTTRPGLRGTIFQLMYFVEAVILARELRRRQFDHLHNHFADSSCTVAMLASEISGIPYSFTLHGSAIFYEAKTWQLGTKLDRAAFCASISHFTRSQAAMFAKPETMERVHIVHCGVQPDELEPVEHTEPGTRLIFVGRLVEQKGLSVLFEAMKSLSTDHPKLSLTVVGDGPDRAALERLADETGLGSQVLFTGSRSPQEVAELLTEADLFVLPSYAEGVPVVAMEALGCGLPVVASLVGGLTELVQEGVTGYLVRPGDSAQLAERINRLLTSPDLRQAMSRAGQAKVNAEFDATVEARRLGSLFTDSLAGRPSELRPPPATPTIGH